MYNFRYHLVTILAIFMSLAIGLLLGAALAGTELVNDVSDDLVASLRKEFADLTEENEGLQKELTATESVNTSFVNEWVNGKLNNKNILVISDATHDSACSSATESLDAAGATYTVITVKKDNFGLEDETVSASFISEFSQFAESEDLQRDVAQALIAEWASAVSGGELPLTTFFTSNDIIELNGDFSIAIDGVVDTALTVANKADTTSALIAYYYSTKDTPVVLTQYTDQTTAIRELATTYSISSMGQMETSLGKYGIVALLAGANAGIYGTDLESGSYVPEIPSAQEDTVESSVQAEQNK